MFWGSAGNTIQAFFILPVQRITRYILLFKVTGKERRRGEEGEERKGREEEGERRRERGGERGGLMSLCRK